MKRHEVARSFSKTTFLLAAAVVLQILTATSALALGVIYVVNSTSDSGHDTAPGDGICETGIGNGVCTLRAAIEDANGHAGTDGIRFSIPTTDPGYNAQTGSWTITLQDVLPAISMAMNITGPGADKLTVKYGHFNITTSGAVSFSGLTIDAGYSDDSGGAIQNANSGTVNITNCTLSNSYAFDAGGAIYNAQTGTITISNSTFKFNSSGGVGGGVWNNIGTINVSKSSFVHNTCSYLGGGIYNKQGVVTLTGSTFSTNYAYFGGGIDNGGTLSVSNSTLYANVAGFNGDGGDGYGGGISNRGTLNLSNSTLTVNYSVGRGSGVFNQVGATANIKSSIIALNYGGLSKEGEAPDVFGAFNSQGFNVIGKTDGSTGFTATTDRRGTVAAPLNPKLDFKGLRSNGGATQTVALQVGSPAIDKGTSASLTGTLTTDQRGSGFPRTVDKPVANAAGGDGTDIGAFELPAP